MGTVLKRVKPKIGTRTVSALLRPSAGRGLAGTGHRPDGGRVAGAAGGGSRSSGRGGARDRAVLLREVREDACRKASQIVSRVAHKESLLGRCWVGLRTRRAFILSPFLFARFFVFLSHAAV